MIGIGVGLWLWHKKSREHNRIKLDQYESEQVSSPEHQALVRVTADMIVFFRPLIVKLCYRLATHENRSWRCPRILSVDTDFFDAYAPLLTYSNAAFHSPNLLLVNRCTRSTGISATATEATVTVATIRRTLDTRVPPAAVDLAATDTTIASTRMTF